MDIQAAHPSKYLKAADLQGQTVRVTIDKVVMEEVGTGEDKQNKPCVYFRGKAKGMALNRINSNTIADDYGDETDNWVGMPLNIFPDKTDYKGKRVDCLRLSVPTQVNEDAPAPAAEPPPHTDDDMPF